MHTSNTLLPEPTFVDIDGVAVATYILEPSRACLGDIVFCHGTPWSSIVWAPVARQLSSHFRIHLWDMPGYGLSSKGRSIAYDLRSQMRRFTAVLRHWNLESPHVIAHDIGGAVALGSHVLELTDFAGVFLWDIVTLDPWGSPFFRLVAENEEVFAGLPPELHDALVREYIAGAALKSLDAYWITALAEPWNDVRGQAAFYQQIAALDPKDTHEVAEKLHTVRCRVRIGWGREDPWIPSSQAAELQARLPGHPSTVMLAGTGHLAPLEKTVEVREAIDEWLNL